MNTASRRQAIPLADRDDPAANGLARSARVRPIRIRELRSRVEIPLPDHRRRRSAGVRAPAARVRPRPSRVHPAGGDTARDTDDASAGRQRAVALDPSPDAMTWDPRPFRRLVQRNPQTAQRGLTADSNATFALRDEDLRQHRSATPPLIRPSSCGTRSSGHLRPQASLTDKHDRTIAGARASDLSAFCSDFPSCSFTARASSGECCRAFLCDRTSATDRTGQAHRFSEERRACAGRLLRATRLAVGSPLLDGLVFRLEQVDSPNWGLGDRVLPVFRLKSLVDEDARFWRHTDFRPRSILELGMSDGAASRSGICASVRRYTLAPSKTALTPSTFDASLRAATPSTVSRRTGESIKGIRRRCVHRRWRFRCFTRPSAGRCVTSGCRDQGEFRDDLSALTSRGAVHRRGLRVGHWTGFQSPDDASARNNRSPIWFASSPKWSAARSTSSLTSRSPRVRDRPARCCIARRSFPPRAEHHSSAGPAIEPWSRQGSDTEALSSAR